MMTRTLKNSRNRTRAADEASARSIEYGLLVIFASIVVSVLTGVCVNQRVPGGIIVGALAILISVAMLGYWWKTYQDRGLTTKPRISFREVYVLYFGMSVEVGLIVHSIIGDSEFGFHAFALILPPMLIGAIAAMDDTPYDRKAERRALPRGIVRKAASAPELSTTPAAEQPAANQS